MFNGVSSQGVCTNSVLIMVSSFIMTSSGDNASSDASSSVLNDRKNTKCTKTPKKNYSSSFPISAAKALYDIKPFNGQCSHYIETSQLICIANQLTGFYMMGTLAVKGLMISDNLFQTTFNMNSNSP